jgi:UDP-glucose 4-epimerase
MIIHCASIIGVNNVNDPFEVHKQITGVSNKILSFYKKKKLLFVYFSSSEIYGDQKIYNEKSGTRIYGFNTTQNLKDIRWVYGESKFFVETCLRFINRNNKNFRFLIFRPFNFFGPRQAQNFVIPKMINDLKNSNKLTIFDNKNITRTFTYIDDAISIIIRLINKKQSHNESYNIGSNKTIKTYDLGNIIINKFKKIDNKKKYKITLNKKIQDPIQERKPKLTRIKYMLKKIKYTNFEKALNRTLEYFLE